MPGLICSSLVEYSSLWHHDVLVPSLWLVAKLWPYTELYERIYKWLDIVGILALNITYYTQRNSNDVLWHWPREAHQWWHDGCCCPLVPTCIREYHVHGYVVEYIQMMSLVVSDSVTVSLSLCISLSMSNSVSLSLCVYLSISV